MFIGISLIALAFGYQVLINASKEKEGLKILGQAIGIFVVLASLAGFVCGAARCAKKFCPSSAKMGCPMTGSQANCPKP